MDIYSEALYFAEAEATNNNARHLKHEPTQLCCVSCYRNCGKRISNACKGRCISTRWLPCQDSDELLEAEKLRMPSMPPDYWCKAKSEKTVQMAVHLPETHQKSELASKSINISPDVLQSPQMLQLCNAAFRLSKHMFVGPCQLYYRGRAYGSGKSLLLWPWLHDWNLHSALHGKPVVTWWPEMNNG